ncbi:unnamed protein product [Linum trigynum]|uniref:Uncharacterized protein n=1 Tax=Linum trigynum TaxID=586398 RepID=A0AAV2FDD9_9ROSI
MFEEPAAPVAVTLVTQPLPSAQEVAFNDSVEISREALAVFSASRAPIDGYEFGSPQQSTYFDFSIHRNLADEIL